MSINPASDIVLDVARAADPSKSLAAMERLSRPGSTQSAASDFAGLIAAPTPGEGELRGQIAPMSGTPAVAAAEPAADDRSKAYKGVEELVLQRLVEAMLPREDSGVFGGGTAGDVWRSMLAEQLAKQIGKSVDLGLVKIVPGARAATGDASHAAATAAPARQRA